MYILQTDFTSEISCLLRSFKVCADAAGILGRMVHQPDAVRAEKLLQDQLVMLFHLFRGKQLPDHTAGHRQQAVLDTCLFILRMPQQLGMLRIFEVEEARNNLRPEHIAVEVTFDPLRHSEQLIRPACIRILHDCRQAKDGLISQRYRPAADHILLQLGIRRLQGIIPVPIPIGGEERVMQEM
ncbi:hypothetical protein D3C75_642340 [compost metagenome]